MSSDFDDRAATWDDDPGTLERARAVAEAVRASVPLDPAMRILEYGAGTGLLTQALVDEVGPVTLTDPSAGMREVLEGKRTDGAFPDASVLDLDLSRDPVPAGRYDLVVTMMVLHHIVDLPPVLAGFAQLLEPGGWLAIADLEREDGSFHDDGFEGHHGIDRDDLVGWLADAGFVSVGFRHAGTTTKHDRPYPLFLATAQRGSGSPSA